jgi:hypothetical protein
MTLLLETAKNEEKQFSSLGARRPVAAAVGMTLLRGT